MVVGPAPAPRFQAIPHVEREMVDTRHADAEGPQRATVICHLAHGRHHALAARRQGPQQARRFHLGGRRGHRDLDADEGAAPHGAIEVAFGRQKRIRIEHRLARHGQQAAKIARGRQLHAGTHAAIEDGGLDGCIQLAEQRLAGAALQRQGGDDLVQVGS
ncbi:hypothetical protein D3C72_1587490 [compost metagenome]